MMYLKIPLLLLLWFMIDPTLSAPDCSDFVDSHRFDCYPDPGATQEKCESRGCCWKESFSSNPDVNVPLNVPYCFYPKNFGYQLVNQQQTSTGYMLDLEMHDKGPFGNDISKLKVDVRLETEYRAHIKIFDPNNKRYEVPVETPDIKQKSTNQDYLISFTHYPFGFAITRKSNGQVLFNSSIGAMVFEDQFIQLSTSLPSHIIYGLGEHVEGFLLSTNWTRLSLFARDAGNPVGGTNLYGVHPLYLNIESDGNANGVFLLNSNAMEIVLQPTPALTYRTIGGILDLYFFLGPEPDTVIQQYTEVIGRPFLPPYWSLGFHLCRWGYNTSNKTREIVERMRKYGIPQDVQWNDIDYMNNHLDFTIDPQKFAELPSLVDDLHQHNQHYIPIVDPGIANTAANYQPYTDGLKAGAFVLNPTSDSPLVGKVWPGTTVFPDFLNASGIAYWQEQIQNFHDKVKFDGLWTDMNEPSNFVDGSTSGCPASKYETPPFEPDLGGGHLTSKTICMGARQGAGLHYNVHSLYGHSELVATSKALQNVRKKRTLVISRSTYPSSGKYGGHWLGDNNSKWPDLVYSIPGVLNFNLFGIPMVGADICGFNGNTSKELCIRWLQVGAFYPFSRNHNTIGAAAQDFPSLGDDVASIARDTYLIRYHLLPYLYTLFYKANSLGSTVARSLMFEFPKDPKTYSLTSQFLWGPALMISPVLSASSTNVNVYFPNALWYDFYNGLARQGHGQTVNLDAPLYKINVHIRGGYIIPLQDPAITTAQSRKNPYFLLVALDESGKAVGDIYLDDGETLNVEKKLFVDFVVQSNTLTSTPTTSGYTPSAPLKNVTVFGLLTKPGKVTVNGESITTFGYDPSLHVLRITSLDLSYVNKFTITWS